MCCAKSPIEDGQRANNCPDLEMDTMMDEGAWEVYVGHESQDMPLDAPIPTLDFSICMTYDLVIYDWMLDDLEELALASLDADMRPLLGISFTSLL